MLGQNSQFLGGFNATLMANGVGHWIMNNCSEITPVVTPSNISVAHQPAAQKVTQTTTSSVTPTPTQTSEKRTLNFVPEVCMYQGNTSSNITAISSTTTQIPDEWKEIIEKDQERQKQDQQLPKCGFSDAYLAGQGKTPKVTCF